MCCVHSNTDQSHTDRAHTDNAHTDNIIHVGSHTDSSVSYLRVKLTDNDLHAR